MAESQTQTRCWASETWLEPRCLWATNKTLVDGANQPAVCLSLYFLTEFSGFWSHPELSLSWILCGFMFCFLHFLYRRPFYSISRRVALILNHASSFAPVLRATLNSSLPLNVVRLSCGSNGFSWPQPWQPCLCHFLVPDNHTRHQNQPPGSWRLRIYLSSCLFRRWNRTLRHKHVHVEKKRKGSVSL